MFIITFFISLIISVILILYMLRLKKDDPFPKGSVRWMLLWGVWCGLLIGGSLALIDEVRAYMIAGDSPILAAFRGQDPYAIKDQLNGFMEAGKPTFFSVFFKAFLTAAIPEEIGKYIVAMYFLFYKKLAGRTPIFNSVICCGLVALGFEMFEDTMFFGDVVVAILRGLLPLHFCVEIIMGYFIGKAIVENKKWYHIFALLIPIMIHGIYDSIIFAIDLSDWLILVFALCYLFVVVLTVIELVLLAKARKKIYGDRDRLSDGGS